MANISVSHKKDETMMKSPETIQKAASLGRGSDSDRIEVLIGQIQGGDRSAAVSLVQCYRPGQIARGIKKNVPKPFHHSFRFILNVAEAEARQIKRD